jgi:hypothetical protein
MPATAAKKPAKTTCPRLQIRRSRLEQWRPRLEKVIRGSKKQKKSAKTIYRP